MQVRHGEQKGRQDPKSREAKWEKVLYKKQPFPDNYTDASFLKDLVRALHFTNFVAPARACTRPTQYLCTRPVLVRAMHR
jgi:hypothetical protein